MANRGTRGITFNLNKSDEADAHAYSFKVNLSDWTRKTVLMVKAVKEQKPELYDFLEQMDLAEFVLRYLSSEKKRMELREKMSSQLDSSQVEYHSGQK